MNVHQIKYLKAFGIIPIEFSLKPGAASQIKAWQELEEQVKNCRACDLCETRSQTVFGVGNTEAKLMVIGEAPGFYEDQEGEPFVGKAGQLLNAMLNAIGFARAEVYIANILKCRPPNNRDPLPNEVELCTPFLEKQISLLQPKVILALGRIATRFLLKSETALSTLRGKKHTYLNIPLIPTYHPAYLLRNPKDKAKTYRDLQAAYQILSE